MGTETKYFTFPIILLEGAFSDIQKVCSNIISYSIYFYSKSFDGESESEKMEKAAKALHVTMGSTKDTLKIAKELDRKNCKTMTSINTSIVWDFRDNYKSHFEIAVFTAFCAIRSIIGKKSYCKTTNLFLLSRMAGEPCQVDYSELPEPLFKYCNEYQLKKIKSELVLHWGLKYYSHFTRGFYVSFSMNLPELVLQAETRKKKYQEKNYSDQQKAAREAALLKLYPQI